MAGGIILLLLVIPLVVRIEGSVMGERSNSFSQDSNNSSPAENKLEPGPLFILVILVIY
jgi:hypothetical protein